MNVFKITVKGNSMEPALQDGASYLFQDQIEPLQENEIIVFSNKKTSEISVKRMKFRINKLVFVIGDNRDNSLDSRHYGMIEYKDILGKMIKDNTNDKAKRTPNPRRTT